MSPLNNEYYEEKTDDLGYTELEWKLATASAVDRVRIVIDHFGSESVTLLTSFGVQSGVMLALGMYPVFAWVFVLSLIRNKYISNTSCGTYNMKS